MSILLNLSGRRRVPIIRQSEAAECGLASIAMIASYHNYAVSLSSLRRRFDVSMKGMTLRTIMDIAAKLGFSARAVRCEVDELAGLQLPALLHWGGNHFVVLVSAGRRHYVINDPVTGQLRLSVRDVSRLFTGIATEITPSPSFRPQRERNPLKLSSLLSLNRDTITALLQSLVLSIVIELLLIASPLYVQIVIDDAVVKGDFGLLGVVATAFAALLLFRALATTLRALSLQFVAQVMAFDMQGRVFRHLLGLPLPWFQKRNVGDIQSRFGAIQPIKSFFANGAIAGLLDGVLGSLVLVLMFIYSWKLTAIVLLSMSTYVAIRVATLHIQRRVAGDAIVTQAIEQTRFLESVRAIETIKTLGLTNTREAQQRNAMAASINASIRAGNVQISYNGVAVILDGLTDILVVYLGALAVMGSTMTLGMLMAFLVYKQQFGMRLTNLIEQAITWRLLSVDLERLSDIALASTANDIRHAGFEGDMLGQLDCRNLTFAYGFGERPALQGVSLSIARGEFVAIIGPSGCGKSTLIKLIVGLYQPVAGFVAIDGKPLEDWNTKAIRDQVAVVTQQDHLLAGSIAENIALFDETIDMNDVRRCASLARIHDEIAAMPMAYETLVGDLGSSLSGGQKQRVLIARALYRKPRILVLDEGTSHLDVDNERAINEALVQLDITRIVVAHRPETIQAAGRRIVMANGRIVADQLAEPSKSAITS